MHFVFGGVENIAERRNCWLPAFSPFSTMFSKGFISRAGKNLNCVEKSSVILMTPRKEYLKTLGKKEELLLPTLLLASIVGFFFPFIKTNHIMLSALTLLQTSPGFLHVCSTSLSRILWEIGKLLITGNFSFSHSVFHPFRKLSSTFIKFKTVVYKLFQFGVL